MELGISEPISGHRQQGDKAGMHQQAICAFPAAAHAHHVVQEHLWKRPAGKRLGLHMQEHISEPLIDKVQVALSSPRRQCTLGWLMKAV